MEALEGVEGAVLLCDGSVDGVETLPATGCIHVPDRLIFILQMLFHSHYQSKVWTHLLMQFLFFLTLQPSTLQIDTEDIR